MKFRDNPPAEVFCKLELEECCVSTKYMCSSNILSQYQTSTVTFPWGGGGELPYYLGEGMTLGLRKSHPLLD